MAKNLFILNDPPYGTERSYNALRLALALAKTDGEQVRVFLMGDGAPCAKAGQKVPQGYYNLGDMLGMVARRNVEIGVCGTCMDARGIADAELVAGAARIRGYNKDNPELINQAALLLGEVPSYQEKLDPRALKARFFAASSALKGRQADGSRSRGGVDV